jgi:hypothetical protein
MTWLQSAGVPTYWQKLKPKGTLQGCRVIGGHEVSEEHVELAGWEDYYPFTILRDPEERMVSLYAWKARRTPQPPFGQWIRALPRDPMLMFLQTCVPGTHIYRLDEMDRALADLGKALRLTRLGYKPIGVTGAGAVATDEQRALVRQFHPHDCKFWAELQLRDS